MKTNIINICECCINDIAEIENNINVTTDVIKRKMSIGEIKKLETSEFIVLRYDKIDMSWKLQQRTTRILRELLERD